MHGGYFAGVVRGALSWGYGNGVRGRRQHVIVK
jgi:hypothetical protein